MVPGSVVLIPAFQIDIWSAVWLKMNLYFVGFYGIRIINAVLTRKKNLEYFCKWFFYSLDVGFIRVFDFFKSS